MVNIPAPLLPKIYAAINNYALIQRMPSIGLVFRFPSVKTKRAKMASTHQMTLENKP